MHQPDDPSVSRQADGSVMGGERAVGVEGRWRERKPLKGPEPTTSGMQAIESRVRRAARRQRLGQWPFNSTVGFRRVAPFHWGWEAALSCRPSVGGISRAGRSRGRREGASPAARLQARWPPPRAPPPCRGRRVWGGEGSESAMGRKRNPMDASHK